MEMRVKSAFEGPVYRAKELGRHPEDTRETLREQQNVCRQVFLDTSL